MVSDTEHIATDTRREWQIGLDPIPNMTDLLEQARLKVLITALPDRISGLTCIVRRDSTQESIPVIVVNRNMTWSADGSLSLAN